MTKQVIVTEQDTDTWALAQVLNEEQIQSLISALHQQDKICIPQFYLPSHLEHYGFKCMEEMNKYTDHLYQFIDEMVMDIEL